MARKAMSCKHLAIFAHLNEVSVPSNPLSIRLSDGPLPGIRRHRGMGVPKAGLGEHRRQDQFRAIDGAVEAVQTRAERLAGAVSWLSPRTS